MLFRSIVSDGNTRTYNVIVTDSDLYLNAEDFSEITRYDLTINNDEEIRFALGSKAVYFQPNTKEYHVTQGDVVYPYTYSGTIQKEGNYYLPMSEVLPWLNTNTSVDNGRLIICNDSYSFWELRGSNIGLFDLTGIDTGSNWTAAGLVALNVFDNFVNVRWQRFVPMIVADSRYERTHTLYDVERYNDCLINLASD